MEHIKKFWFCSKIFWKNRNVLLLQKKEVGTHQKVLVLFQNFWNKQKRSTLGLWTHQNVLVSFRFLASISERLCFRFVFIDITRAPENTLTPLQQSQSLYRVALSQALSLPLQTLLWPQLWDLASLSSKYFFYKHLPLRWHLSLFIVSRIYFKEK